MSMKKSSSTIIHILFFLTLGPLVSKAQDVNEIVSNYFTAVRSGEYPAIPIQLSHPENAFIIFNLLPPYLQDSLASIRAKSYEIIHQSSSHSPDPSVRNHGVDMLIRACRDQDFGNIGFALSCLTEFSTDDFNQSAKDSIKNLVRTPTAHFDQVLKLAGFLNLTDLKEDIRPYAQPGNTSQIRWAAILSLARMGESSSIKDMMKRVTQLPMNDDIVYEVFPDLVYTRQPEAIIYLVEILNSDVKNCMSADAERETPIVCGYRIMEQLAPIIEGYPLLLDENGDVNTNDYTGALDIARQWFQTHKTFKIRNDRF